MEEDLRGLVDHQCHGCCAFFSCSSFLTCWEELAVRGFRSIRHARLPHHPPDLSHSLLTRQPLQAHQPAPLPVIPTFSPFPQQASFLPQSLRPGRPSAWHILSPATAGPQLRCSLLERMFPTHHVASSAQRPLIPSEYTGLGPSLFCSLPYLEGLEQPWPEPALSDCRGTEWTGKVRESWGRGRVHLHGRCQFSSGA